MSVTRLSFNFSNACIQLQSCQWLMQLHGNVSRDFREPVWQVVYWTSLNTPNLVLSIMKTARSLWITMSVSFMENNNNNIYY